MWFVLYRKQSFMDWSFDGKTVNGQTYLAMVQKWLLAQMNDDSDDFIFPSRELHFIVTRKFEFF
jgi:hypothetical protein